MINETIRLFKALKVDKEQERRTDVNILTMGLERGFYLTPEVMNSYSHGELLRIIQSLENEYGLTPEEANATLHKSWEKVATAPEMQLFFEQVLHYITTYGFQSTGQYSDDTIYIPNEELNIPNLKKGEKTKFIVIKGFDKDGLESKLMSFLSSGVALKEQTVKDCVAVFRDLGIDSDRLTEIKNKEVSLMLFEATGNIPENPVEFLRYLVYTTTGKTLLIKSREAIEEFRQNQNISVSLKLDRYISQYGIEKLASIFYRFKPLFLAMKEFCGTRINKIRKLAPKHHKPMKEDYLNMVTSQSVIDLDELESNLADANNFRKIRLAYALQYRLSNPGCIVHKIRNGKAFARKFDNKPTLNTQKALSVVLDSIIQGVKTKVDGKTILIPKDLELALPATEKQFTGNLPSGSNISLESDMIFGVHWKNNVNKMIDLDLSLLNVNGKIGWDSSYRSGDGRILFSGDITSAPAPLGATELFYVKNKAVGTHLLNVNYYNYSEDSPVDIKILVGQNELSLLPSNYVIDPNKIKGVSKSVIDKKQTTLGMLDVTNDRCTFYFSEMSVGNNITSSDVDYITWTREYLKASTKGVISLNNILEEAGAIVVHEKYSDDDQIDIDLSFETLTKDSIIGLLS